MLNPNHLASIVFVIAIVYFFLNDAYIPAYVCAVAGATYIHTSLQTSNSNSNDKNTTTTSPLDKPARYIDWALTTPLIIYVIMDLSNIFTEEQKIAVAIADLGMIAAGYMGTQQPQYTVPWFIAGSILFAPVLYSLVLVMQNSINNSSNKSNSNININTAFIVAALTLTIWLVYPFLYIFCKYNILPTDASQWIVVVLDMVAKVGFGLLES